jgi:hypothetical protein
MGRDIMDEKPIAERELLAEVKRILEAEAGWPNRPEWTDAELRAAAVGRILARRRNAEPVVRSWGIGRHGGTGGSRYRRDGRSRYS